MQIRNQDLSWQVAGDEIVILDLRASVYLKLNGSARFLWQALADETTEDELVHGLAHRYEIDVERASADVATFLSDLRARDLVVD